MAASRARVRGRAQASASGVCHTSTETTGRGMSSFRRSGGAAAPIAAAISAKRRSGARIAGSLTLGAAVSAPRFYDRPTRPGTVYIAEDADPVDATISSGRFSAHREPPYGNALLMGPQGVTVEAAIE